MNVSGFRRRDPSFAPGYHRSNIMSSVCYASFVSPSSLQPLTPSLPLSRVVQALLYPRKRGGRRGRVERLIPAESLHRRMDVSNPAREIQCRTFPIVFSRSLHEEPRPDAPGCRSLETASRRGSAVDRHVAMTANIPAGTSASVNEARHRAAFLVFCGPGPDGWRGWIGALLLRYGDACCDGVHGVRGTACAYGLVLAVGARMCQLGRGGLLWYGFPHLEISTETRASWQRCRSSIGRVICFRIRVSSFDRTLSLSISP